MSDRRPPFRFACTPSVNPSNPLEYYCFRDVGVFAVTPLIRTRDLLFLIWRMAAPPMALLNGGPNSKTASMKFGRARRTGPLRPMLVCWMVIAAWLAGFGNASACTVVGAADRETAIAGADYVVYGRVVRSVTAPLQGASPIQQEARVLHIETLETLKGDHRESWSVAVRHINHPIDEFSRIEGGARVFVFSNHGAMAAELAGRRSGVLPVGQPMGSISIVGEQLDGALSSYVAGEDRAPLPEIWEGFCVGAPIYAPDFSLARRNTSWILVSLTGGAIFAAVIYVTRLLRSKEVDL